MSARTIVHGVALSAALTAVAAVAAAQPRGGSALAGPIEPPVYTTADGQQRTLPDIPPEPRFTADPADSLYRRARQAVVREDFLAAAELFRQLRERYPESGWTVDAMYWEAYARFRRGGPDELREALRVLELRSERYPDAHPGDTPALRARINGALAMGGDPDAAMAVVRSAGGGQGGSAGAPGAPGASGQGSTTRAASGSGGASGQRGVVGTDCPTESNDERIVALNALLQMDSDRALPLLERVLARRDECSAPLRRRAMFLVAQKSGPRREEILLSAVRSDPDPEVREQAVFWLSQTQSERTVEVLDELLRSSTDDRVRDKALFSLSQQKSPEATRTLRAFAERRDSPRALRERAIFWLGQRPGGADASYLRELYGKLDDAALKERVLFSVAQAKSAENQRFLLGVARDPRETAELRGKAIFWLGQGSGVPSRDLGTLYEQIDDRQVKEQIVFALAQRPNDREAVDMMMNIARRDTDRQMRERTIFWLSQSKDPRVLDFLMEIIDK
jgi:hypothetical protein